MVLPTGYQFLESSYQRASSFGVLNMNSQYVYEKVSTLILNLVNENKISYQTGKFQTQCSRG